MGQPTLELKLALKDIAFTVKEGEKVLIIGPNGAGKSTLLLNIAGLMDGEYKKGDISIFEKNPKQS
ncbi:MAG: ATP-binding cassette domain-containing protein [Candidatus Humimicrobiaceae bacterium]